MLLGNNFNNNPNAIKPLGNSFENNQFTNKNHTFQQNINLSNNKKNIFTHDLKTQQHINPINKNDMADKTLAILHQRLEQGSISLEEFNKRCTELGKKRNQQ